MLDNWSLNITPQITVTPVNESNGYATTFQLGFPMQYLSGTYTVQLSPDILDTFGQMLDTSQNAGVDVLRNQGQKARRPRSSIIRATCPKRFPLPPQLCPVLVTSTINVPDSFVVQGDSTSSGISGLRVQISLTYPVDPDLSATLYYDYGGPGQMMVPLFNNVGSGTNTANFTNTIFDDQSTTPIENGAAPLLCDVRPADAADAPSPVSMPGGMDTGDPECHHGEWGNWEHRHAQ